MNQPETTVQSRAARRLLAGVLVVALLAAGGLLLRRLLHDEVTKVPLGVEHAVTLRYSGPDLAVKPFDREVAVHLRIAGIAPRGHSLVYDVRYVVDRPGRYNIMDYLAGATGGETADLPPFVVQATAKAGDTIGKRVQTIEPVGIHFWHWYRETLAMLAVLWLAWLAALIFWHRHHHRKRPPAPPDYDAFYELLQAFLDRLDAGGLDAAGKLELEQLMLGWWRKQCASHDGSMYAVVQKLAADPAVGGAYQILEQWLHDADTTISKADVIQALHPYTARPPDAGAAGNAEGEARS